MLNRARTGSSIGRHLLILNELYGQRTFPNTTGSNNYQFVFSHGLTSSYPRPLSPHLYSLLLYYYANVLNVSSVEHEEREPISLLRQATKISKSQFSRSSQLDHCLKQKCSFLFLFFVFLFFAKLPRMYSVLIYHVYI